MERKTKFIDKGYLLNTSDVVFEDGKLENYYVSKMHLLMTKCVTITVIRNEQHRESTNRQRQNYTVRLAKKILADTLSYLLEELEQH